MEATENPTTETPDAPEAPGFDGFEAITPPPRSNLWKPEQVDAANRILAEHGKVGWGTPYESEGKARGQGSALARLLHDKNPETAYRVSVFKHGEGAPNGVGGFYFSIRPKGPAAPAEDGPEYDRVNPESHNRAALLALALAENPDTSDRDYDGWTKRQFAEFINAGRKERAAAETSDDTPDDTPDAA